MGAQACVHRGNTGQDGRAILVHRQTEGLEESREAPTGPAGWRAAGGISDIRFTHACARLFLQRTSVVSTLVLAGVITWHPRLKKPLSAQLMLPLRASGTVVSILTVIFARPRNWYNFRRTLLIDFCFNVPTLALRMGLCCSLGLND